jgi:DNA-binding transcriptional MerR regulator/methylmalonyl-CoA mutase cobalamin-binding subunit
MYTIKQAAARSGVPVQLLRAWERRYGVVSPVRSDSGYRLYDDPAIDRLRAMRRLIDSGWAPSTAATRIRDLDEASVSALVGTEIAAVRVPAPMAALAAGELADAFVAAAADLDEPVIEQILDDMFARGSFEQVTANLVMPALAALGDGWRAGRIDIAAEHAAAGAVQRRLGSAFMAAGRPSEEQPAVLVGLPPGARHDLGALAFATAARRSGVEVRYLGSDLPVQDWLDAVARTTAAGVVIGVVIASDVDPAERVGLAIRAANPRVVIAFGGPAASAVDLSSSEPAMVLSGDLITAVDAVRSAVGSRASLSSVNMTRPPRVATNR